MGSNQKRFKFGTAKQQFLANKKRQSDYQNVLGTLALKSERHYWEIKIEKYVDEEHIHRSSQVRHYNICKINQLQLKISRVKSGYVQGNLEPTSRYQITDTWLYRMILQMIYKNSEVVFELYHFIETDQLCRNILQSDIYILPSSVYILWRGLSYFKFKSLAIFKLLNIFIQQGE
ncbi:unnamed protein product [Paramecium sonneborni]|uniref:Uncharacterized protein n=1 Tax=Paramecium sonneborni TaxID=65129 RepID=A0A8S1N212_9CILI|nr:unnamed protein product [Paramecium sonneborni]